MHAPRAAAINRRFFRSSGPSARFAGDILSRRAGPVKQFRLISLDFNLRIEIAAGERRFSKK